jgi:UDP-2,3-diacylglucosamine pyrophosphatase LpxH
VSHGDEFDPEHVGRSWLTWIGDYAHGLLRWLNRCLNGLRRRLGLAYLPLAIITKSRLGRALAYIEGFESRVAAHDADTGYDGHICGHIHFGNIRRIGDTVYMNDGDWVEHCTALVEDHAGVMELLHWSEHRTALARADGERLAPALARDLAFASFTPQRVEAWRKAA